MPQQNEKYCVTNCVAHSKGGHEARVENIFFPLFQVIGDIMRNSEHQQLFPIFSQQDIPATVKTSRKSNNVI